MSETPDSTDDLLEQQRHAMEQGQRTLTRSTMVPLRQAMTVQQNLGEAFVNGLELNESIQQMGIDLTRSAFQSYLDSIEDVVADTTREARREPRGTTGEQPASGPQQPQQGQQSRGTAPAYGSQQTPPRTSPQQQSPQQPPSQQASPRGPPQNASSQNAPPQQAPLQRAPPQQVPAGPPYAQQQPEQEYPQSPPAGQSQ